MHPKLPACRSLSLSVAWVGTKWTELECQRSNKPRDEIFDDYRRCTQLTGWCSRPVLATVLSAETLLPVLIPASVTVLVGPRYSTILRFMERERIVQGAPGGFGVRVTKLQVRAHTIIDQSRGAASVTTQYNSRKDIIGALLLYCSLFRDGKYKGESVSAWNYLAANK